MQYIFWALISIVAIDLGLLIMAVLSRRSTNPGGTGKPRAHSGSGQRLSTRPPRRVGPSPASPTPYRPPAPPTAYETAVFPDEDDGYVAANFYDEVADILAASLEKQPERQDLRLKLLEVLSTAGHRDQFVREARHFRSRMVDKESEDWQTILRLGQSLFRDADLLATLLSDPDQIPKTGEKRALKPRGKGRSRRFGESITDESQLAALEQLRKDYSALQADPGFLSEVDRTIRHYSGDHAAMPYHARRLSQQLGGCQIYLKREGQRVRGSHKLINAMGQGVMAKRLNKRLLVAGTVSGNHGLAVAQTAAHLGMRAVIYMPESGRERAEYQLAQMRLLGAQVKFLESPGKTKPRLYDSNWFNQVLWQVRTRAMEHWAENPDNGFFANGLAAGPDPYPRMLRDFHGIIGREARNALVRATGKLPSALLCCVNGDIDAIGFFTPFLAYDSIRLFGAEQGLEEQDKKPGKDPYGEDVSGFYSGSQVATANAILTGRGYPSTRREHKWLRETRRVHYVKVSRTRARQACEQIAQAEGLVITDDSAYALAVALRIAPRFNPDQYITIQMSDSGEGALSDIALD